MPSKPPFGTSAPTSPIAGFDPQVGVDVDSFHLEETRAEVLRTPRPPAADLRASVVIERAGAHEITRGRAVELLEGAVDLGVAGDELALEGEQDGPGATPRSCKA